MSSESIDEEIEILRAIYPDRLNGTCPDTCISLIYIFVEEIDEEQVKWIKISIESGKCHFILRFGLQNGYPLFEAPIIQIYLPTDQKVPFTAKMLHEILMIEAKQSIGMPSIFSLVSLAESWILEKLQSDLASRQKTLSTIDSFDDSPKDHLQDQRLILIDHDQIMQGEPVTVESFQRWNKEFMQEIRESERLQAKKSGTESRKLLTGICLRSFSYNTDYRKGNV